MAEKEHYNVRTGSSYARSIGITHRTTPLASPWTGDMRVRFSDFQVNEISKDGNVVHLHNVGLAGDPKQAAAQIQEAGESKSKETTPANVVQEEAPALKAIEVPAEDITALENLAGQAFTQELIQLFNKGNGPEGGKGGSITSQVIDDKSKRTQLHGEVRRIFKSQIDTSTGHNGAVVASFMAPKRGKKRSNNRGRRDRGDDEQVGEYLHFTLYKDNRDTMDAVSQISRLLRVKPQIIAYAGTKDRRASTTQRCSVRYTRKRALAGLNGKLWGITTGDYEYKDEPIHLGQLLGNEFVITLKNCKLANGAPEAQSLADDLEAITSNVQSALDHMASHGWINYFGHQRFGTHDVGTHQVGKLILGDKFEAAVDALLQYDPETAAKAESGEVPDEGAKKDEYARHQACMLFKTGKDYDKAVKVMPRRFAAESCILRHLTRMGNGSLRDFAGAITHITRGLRSMYLHAYQSHVWNHAASRRWELFGDKVVKGDLVIADTETQPLVAGQDQDGDDIINPTEDEEEGAVKARPLSEEEATSGKYSIYDIVLPSPGYDVIYPDNELHTYYEEFMGHEDNGGLDPHKMRRLRREFSLPGRYRKLMNRFLAEPSIEFKLYADETEQMHPTDLDLLKAEAAKVREQSKRKRDEVDEEQGSAEKRAKGDEEKVETEQGQQTDAAANGDQPTVDQDAANPDKSAVEPTKVAVVVKFQLASSAYATVVMRELMGEPANDSEST